MRDYILDGQPPLALTLRRSARARRITLRVSALDGRVTLTCPKSVDEREALAFAHEKEQWIRGHLEHVDAPLRVGQYSQIPIEGESITIKPGNGPRACLQDHNLFVSGKPEIVGAKVQSFLKVRAQQRFAQMADRYAATLGKTYSVLAIRDPRSRWGSCSSSGRLMFSWRLIMAPPSVLDYVAAHEVAHLAEMNHSARFWQHVEDLYGPHKAARRWLRENGSKLHAYRFID